MKFFSEFKSCWGGAMVTPAAEADGGGRRTEEPRIGYCHNNYGRTTSKRVAITHNRRPKLHAISEDRPISEAGRGGVNRLTGGADGKKRPVKVEPKSTARDEEHYWKSAHTMALPAFAPTPFLF